MNIKSLSVLERLLNADSENVRLNACKLVLECNGYSRDSNVNVKVNDMRDRSDDDLLSELKTLISPEQLAKLNS